MTVDQFIASNHQVWGRLDELARRGAGRLTADEIAELVEHYQRTGTHLSYARTSLGEQALVAHLTRLVARAGGVIYGSRPRTLRSAGRFFADTFPAALWYSRWFVAVAAALFLLPAAIFGLWMVSSPRVLDVAAPPELREAYVAEDFVDYYSNLPSPLFGSMVTTNNIRVGALAFAGGIGLCLPTAALLVFNGLNLGFAWALFAVAGQQGVFWTYILPHGLLEITAIVVAGAAGLRLGWTLVDPGDRPRGTALLEEGRRAIVVVLGLALVFAVAGAIEGFVTGSDLPPAVRLAVGVAAEAAFLGYVVVRGRDAARRGLTGALGEADTAGWATR